MQISNEFLVTLSCFGMKWNYKTGMEGWVSEMKYIDRQPYGGMAEEVEGEATKHSEYIITGGFVAFRNVTYTYSVFIPWMDHKGIPQGFSFDECNVKSYHKSNAIPILPKCIPKSVLSRETKMHHNFAALFNHIKLCFSGRLDSPEIGAFERTASNYANHGCNCLTGSRSAS